jgi:hypothetical protein
MMNCEHITNQFEDILDCVVLEVYQLVDFQNTNLIKETLSNYGYNNSQFHFILNHPTVFFLVDSTTLKVAYTKQEVINIIKSLKETKPCLHVMK